MSKPRETSLLPVIESQMVELASAGADAPARFRKKILPLATIQYPKTPRHPGGPVTFDHAYHQSLIDAYGAGAFDDVPLQLATADNAHNMLPERTAGHIVGLSHMREGDVDGPGLYADMEPNSPASAELFRKNPKLGVSPEIIEGFGRVDGFKAKRALRHVLATLAPRVVGLGQWRAVSLSEDEHDNGQLIDLSAAEYEEIDMGKQSDTLELSEADLDAALAAAAAEFGEVDDDEPTIAGGGAGVAGAGTAVALSDDTRRVVLGLSAEMEETRLELAQQRADLGHERWLNERQQLSLAGVPKHVLDLAAELLDSSTEGVLELSCVDDDGALASREVDAKDVVRKMLAACKGIVELSDTVPGLSGEPGSDGATEAAEKIVEKGIELWDARSGKIS